MTTSPWISVKDRLPNPDVLVLVSHLMEDFSRPTVSFYSCRELCYWRRNEWRSIQDIWVPSVTHWMPLPDAPKPEDPFETWWGDREFVVMSRRGGHSTVHRDCARAIWDAAIASQKIDKQQP